jgi:hypothetical protein
MPSPDFLSLNPEYSPAEPPQRHGATRKAPRTSRDTPAPQKPAQRVKAGSARARCAECGAIVGKGRNAPTCAPCDLVALIVKAGLPRPLREVKFAAPARKWSADLGWPERGLLCEVDGGQFAPRGGRHATDKDREKLNHAAALGYRVVRLSPQQIAREPAACIDVLRRCLDG